MKTLVAHDANPHQHPRTFGELAEARSDGPPLPVTVVTSKQLASILGVHPATLRRMAQSGQLPVRSVNVDSWPRYSVRSVLQWILEREPTAADFDADCRLLTIAQAAKLLGCSRATGYRLLGKPSPPITPTPVGEELRFPAQRVLAFTHATP